MIFFPKHRVIVFTTKRPHTAREALLKVFPTKHFSCLKLFFVIVIFKQNQTSDSHNRVRIQLASQFYLINLL